MSTAATITTLIEPRTEIESTDDNYSKLLSVLDLAVKIIAKRLYHHKSHLVKELESIALETDDSSGTLPTGFWGLWPGTYPWIDGKKWCLRPLPDTRTRLLYTSSGEPRYYEILKTTIDVIPATSSDITLKMYCFIKPDTISASTSTIPWDELFDDALAEYLIRYYQEWWEEEAPTPQDLLNLKEFLFHAVDQVIAHRDQRVNDQIQDEMDWEGMFY
jgi:hypothetical protein